MTEHVLIALIAAIGAITAAMISALSLFATRQTQARVDELLVEARRIAYALGYQQAEDDQMALDARRHLHDVLPPEGT